MAGDNDKTSAEGNNSVESASNPDRNAEDNSDANKPKQSVEDEALTSHGDGQEEDVPEDFFDDFFKEDFMAGLDIVDEDDEDQDDKNKDELTSKQVQKLEKLKERRTKLKRSAKEKIDHVRKFRESPPGKLKHLTKKGLKKKTYDEELKRLNAELDQIKNNPNKKQGKVRSEFDADIFDIRRDPDKTREAIQRDKLKSAKDKEKRLITDIVETGLVPPGMELEVGLEEVRRIEKNERSLPVGDLREKLQSWKSKSKSPEKIKSTIKKKTPIKKRSASPLRRRKSRSPKKKESSVNTSKISQDLDADRNKNVSRRSSEKNKRSTVRKSPLLRRSRSPLLRRNSPLQRTPIHHRSPFQRRSPLLRSPTFKRKSRSRSFTRSRKSPARRRSRSRGPMGRRSRTRSPLLHRRSRSRNRSPAYRRRNRAFSPQGRGRRSRSPVWREEKMSFLEELAVKLNETHPPVPLQPVLPVPAPVNYVMPLPPQSIIAPVPAPVPPPQSFFSAPVIPQSQHTPPVGNHFDRYDQNFFIGNTVLSEEQHYDSSYQASTEVMSLPNGFPSRDLNVSSNKDITKLFGDKRITLSDFLAITAKPSVNNSPPGKLQEKIKVIQRCHEGVKILNEKRFSGPLVVHKMELHQTSKDMTMSPLLRKPIIQLPYTTPGLKKTNEVNFTKSCEMLLQRLGIEKTFTSHKETEKSKITPPKEAPQKEIAPPVFSNKPNYFEAPTPIKAITKASSTQTDKELSSCKECLRRKGVLYAHCGIQAGSPTLTFSVSTQVNEADFYAMIPKTQSLATLTPAQLLGKQSMITDHSRGSRTVSTQENMSRANFQVPSPPPPPLLHFFPPREPLFPQPPQPLFNQPPMPPSIPSLLQVRPNFSDNQPNFSDNRRGYSNKRF